MKEHNALTLAKLELDRRLYTELKQLGVITTKADISRMCGKNDSYYACMHNKGYGIQLGSLAFLAARLKKRIQAENDSSKITNITQGIQFINKTIAEKIKLKEYELM
jgi:hypothetical protein